MRFACCPNEYIHTHTHKNRVKKRNNNDNQSFSICDLHFMVNLHIVNAEWGLLKGGNGLRNGMPWRTVRIELQSQRDVCLCDTSGFCVCIFPRSCTSSRNQPIWTCIQNHNIALCLLNKRSSHIFHCAYSVHTGNGVHFQDECVYDSTQRSQTRHGSRLNLEILVN